MDEKNIFDVLVIGGGPAGMMAAGRAAECGARVGLIEKNKSLGEKLLLTGGGRCNLTNHELNTRKFLEKFKEHGKFLFSVFSQYGVKETLIFFHARKLETKTEEGGRVFPLNDKASSVFDVLGKYMQEGRVTVFSGNPVKKMFRNGNTITSVRLKDGKEICARAIILATGGKSHPETGSTGDGFLWLEELGHTVIPPKPSLVPLAIKEKWVKSMQGVVLSDIKISALQNGEKRMTKKGNILFTHFGVSGPTILNMSGEIGELLKYGEVILSIDMFPSHGHGDLNKKIQEVLKKENNKKIKNVIGALIPVASFEPIVLSRSGIDPDKFCHSVTREERLALIAFLKNIPMHVEKLLGVEKSIVTSGGVPLTEVDSKTMRSRLFSNLYFAGDILNIDRPSGGYSLQLCWTTGYVAGTSACEFGEKIIDFPDCLNR